MLASLGMLIIAGWALSQLSKKVGLPPLVGMILAGIILGPSILNVISAPMIAVAPDLRTIALVIILVRAGLTLKLDDLKQAGRPAAMLCCVPAIFEIGGFLLLAPLLFDIPFAEAGVMGTVLAAVSPAVIVPAMIQIIDKGYGEAKKIPQMILAGASVDDVFVIVCFSFFTQLSLTGESNLLSLLKIPVSIILGILFGYIVGKGFVAFFKTVHVNDTLKVGFILSVAFILLALQDMMTYVPFSALLAVMCMAMVIGKDDFEVAERLAPRFQKLWTIAEIVLFTLVGVAVQLSAVSTVWLPAILVILCALVIRMVGVLVSVAGSPLTWKERFFTAGAYTPKATVQAATGTLPLQMGIASGEIILSVAVMAILITAPLGSIWIERSYPKLLQR